LQNRPSTALSLRSFDSALQNQGAVAQDDDAYRVVT